MKVSEGLQKKIKLLFADNEEMKQKLLEGNEQAIREVGLISQSKKWRIKPEEIVEAYESGNKDKMEAIYKRAKMLYEFQKLYKELCLEYCNQVRDEGR